MPALPLIFLWFILINQVRVEWTVNPQYSYGWAVPFLCLYLAWRNVTSPPPLPFSPRNRNRNRNPRHPSPWSRGPHPRPPPRSHAPDPGGEPGMAPRQLGLSPWKPSSSPSSSSPPGPPFKVQCLRFKVPRPPPSSSPPSALRSAADVLRSTFKVRLFSLLRPPSSAPRSKFNVRSSTFGVPPFLLPPPSPPLPPLLLPRRRSLAHLN